MPLKPGQVVPTSYGQKEGNKPGGKKGKNPRAGRPTKSFYEYLKDLRTSATVQAAFKQALSDPNCKGFAAALRVLSEYDSERPALKRETSGVVSVKVEVAREGKRDLPQEATKTEIHTSIAPSLSNGLAGQLRTIAGLSGGSVVPDSGQSQTGSPGDGSQTV